MRESERKWACLHVRRFKQSECHAAFIYPDDEAQLPRGLSSDALIRKRAGWSWRREVMARYLNVLPDLIRFSISPLGKRSLSSPPQSDFQFSWSETTNWSALLIAVGVEVGVDVEKIDPEDVPAMAKANLSPREYSEWMLLPSEQQVRDFYLHWTAKEAYVKATGQGLQQAPQDVEFIPSKQGSVRSVLDGKEWCLYRHDLDANTVLTALCTPLVVPELFMWP